MTCIHSIAESLNSLCNVPLLIQVASVIASVFSAYFACLSAKEAAKASKAAENSTNLSIQLERMMIAVSEAQTVIRRNWDATQLLKVRQALVKLGTSLIRNGYPSKTACESILHAARIMEDPYVISESLLIAIVDEIEKGAGVRQTPI